jgi:hypothetical protein
MEGPEPVLSFADINLKNKLLEASESIYIAKSFSSLGGTTIDTNSDGEIQVTEAQRISELGFGEGNIEDISGIEGSRICSVFLSKIT